MKSLMLIIAVVFSSYSHSSQMVLTEYRVNPDSERCLPTEFIFLYLTPDDSTFELHSRVGDTIVTYPYYTFNRINEGEFETQVASSTGESLTVTENNTYVFDESGSKFVSSRMLYGDLYQSVIMEFEGDSLTLKLGGNSVEDRSCSYTATPQD